MVLRFNRAGRLLLVAGLSLLGCVTPNDYGLLFLPEAGADGAEPPAPVSDAGVEAPPVDAPAVPRDSATPDAPPADAAAAPDAMVPECTPNAVGCSANNRQVRTCNAQGRWVDGQTCAATDVCSAGACLCASPNCEDGTIRRVDTPVSTLVGDMAAGTRSLFLALNGASSSILRFDIQSPQNTVLTTVHEGARNEGATYALDADAMDNLVWCSLGMISGEIVYGDNPPLDTGPCTDVQRRESFIYYKTTSLHRRALGSDQRETLTNQTMKKFVVTADAVYFIGATDDGSARETFLGRLSLSDLDKVDILVRRPDNLFLDLQVDGTHVYAWTADELLRVPLGGGQPESLWHEQGPELWSATQSDSHLYWSVNVPGNGCVEAQVWRRPKAGGDAKIIASRSGQCAGPLVRLGDRVYVVTWVPPPDSSVLLRRIRL